MANPSWYVREQERLSAQRAISRRERDDRPGFPGQGDIVAPTAADIAAQDAALAARPVDAWGNDLGELDEEDCE